MKIIKLISREEKKPIIVFVSHIKYIQDGYVNLGPGQYLLVQETYYEIMELIRNAKNLNSIV